jgi:hypothetical protein
LRKEIVSIVMSVHLSVGPLGTTQLQTYRILWILIFIYFSKTCWQKLRVYLNKTRITGTLHEDQYRYLVTSCSLLLRMKNVSDKVCKENINTYFMLNHFFFLKIVPFMRRWKNMVQPDRPQMTIWRKYIACWIPKATNTNLEYITPTFFLRQQLLNKSASMSRYEYIVCLV